MCSAIYCVYTERDCDSILELIRYKLTWLCYVEFDRCISHFQSNA